MLGPIGVAMTSVRWTCALARLPSRVFHRLGDWAWWTFDDSGKPMPKRARRAAGAATLILAGAAVGASVMQWLEPGRAAILWGWFTILAIVASAVYASRQNAPSRGQRTSNPSHPGASVATDRGSRLSLRERVRALPRNAALAVGAAARRMCVRAREAAPGHAAKAWRVSCQAGKATHRCAVRAAGAVASAVNRRASNAA